MQSSCKGQAAVTADEKQASSICTHCKVGGDGCHPGLQVVKQLASVGVQVDDLPAPASLPTQSWQAQLTAVGLASGVLLGALMAMPPEQPLALPLASPASWCCVNHCHSCNFQHNSPHVLPGAVMTYCHLSKNQPCNPPHELVGAVTTSPPLATPACMTLSLAQGNTKHGRCELASFCSYHTQYGTHGHPHHDIKPQTEFHAPSNFKACCNHVFCLHTAFAGIETAVHARKACSAAVIPAWTTCAKIWPNPGHLRHTDQTPPKAKRDRLWDRPRDMGLRSAPASPLRRAVEIGVGVAVGVMEWA
eukprot:1157229-Pelagomonas_calceolata.AAC.3